METFEHGILGALVSLGLYEAYKHLRHENPTVQEVLGSLVLGGFAGILPDLIEPPTNPNHRSFFHSSALLGLFAYGNKKVLESPKFTDNQKLFVTLFSAAFGSHLASDSTTAKGIPLLL